MAGFRSLAENEVVEFQSKYTNKGVEAVIVTGPDRKNLEGSKFGGKKRHFRKTR